MAEAHASPAGSEWHRWEPHIHAPGTLFADRYTIDWDAYVTAIENASPAIEALGITDYYTLESYTKALGYKAKGRMPGVKLLFPNIEFRLTIETEKRKGINLHLLFSPADPDHIQQIERVLLNLSWEFDKTTYRCRPDDLARLGRAVDPKQKDEAAAIRTGALQFKISFDELKKLYRNDRWLQNNCLIAVAGAEHDGTAGLQADAAFWGTRVEIERFAHIIFSGLETTRTFWLGRKPGMDQRTVEATYGFLKPCLHGSDAHNEADIGKPTKGRMCWIKSDLTFEGLRQAVIEPAERVCIGPVPPGAAAAFNRLHAVGLSNAPWFQPAQVPLNRGLVAIIGARGSGKTALADAIACGARALAAGSDASFVHRASHPENLIDGVTVELQWSDGTSNSRPLREPDPFEDESPQVQYLSQQFVERLCSNDGLGAELVSEIERVVFEATDETDRYGEVTFDGLRDARLEPLRSQRATYVSAIDDASKLISEQDALKESLPAEMKKLDALEKTIAAAAKEIEGLLPKGSESRAKRFADLDTACAQAEKAIQALRLKKQKVEELATEAERVRTRDEPQRLSAMKRRYDAAGLTADEWSRFAMVFVGDVDEVTGRLQRQIEAEIEKRVRVQPGQNPPEQLDASSPLPFLRAAREAAQKDVGVDEQKAKRFKELKAQLAAWQAEKVSLEKRIELIGAADQRRKQHGQERRVAYLGIFDSLEQAQTILEELYGPLLERVKTVRSAAKLEFVVVRRVDVDAWVKLGEDLLDLRSALEFRGHGTLKKAVEQELLQAWLKGGSGEVAAAMSKFVENHANAITAGRPSSSTPDEIREWSYRVSQWLFSTEHITLQYGLRYDGVDVQKLSPGTRGIVLLTLYLAIDEWDKRPLLVDQPEENLDPQSVYQELVAFFRQARSRRQVILVTHNANLVVNTDADQVIIASAKRKQPKGLPEISYVSGSLENKTIRDGVCELLEGGAEAFRARERRYRLRWLQDDA